MKCFVTGVMRRAGRANKGQGNPYDFSQVHLLNQITERSNEYSQTTGTGFEAATIDCTSEAVESFKKANLQLPAWLELNVENEMRNGRVIPVVTGLAKVAA